MMKRTFGDSPFADTAHLGRGAFGEVYSALQSQNSGFEQRVAVKRIPLSNSRRHTYHNLACLREVLILRALSADADAASVVRLDRVMAATTPNGCLLSLHLIMPCMDTDLRQLLRELGGGHLSWRRSEWLGYAKLISYQLFRALHYVHSCNIIHRDVKPSNILLNVKCGRPFAVALCDFGMARIVDDEYDHSGYLTEEVVTRWYRPPEVLFSSKSYSRSADMWSAGCVFAEMLVCGAGVLFRGQNDADQLRRIIDVLGWPGDEAFQQVMNSDKKLEDRGRFCELLSGCSGQTWPEIFPLETDAAAIDLLSKLLVFDPTRRLDTTEVLYHPYFEQLHSTESMSSCTPPETTRFHIEDELSSWSMRNETILHQLQAEAELFVPTSSEVEFDFEEGGESADQHAEDIWADKCLRHANGDACDERTGSMSITC